MPERDSSVIIPNIPSPKDNLDFTKTSEGVYDPNAVINKYKILDQLDSLTTGYSFIFITTPSLNFSKDNLNKEPFFRDIKQTEPYLLDYLTTSPGKSPFIRILTNRAKSFETKDTVLRTRTVGETFEGYKLQLGGSPVESLVADQFSITYWEDSNLTIIKLHKIWTEYMEHVRRGRFVPSKQVLETGTIDYLSSLYYFLLSPDGETIIYYAKYTGVAPIAVPYSSLGYRLGEINSNVELTIPYIYSFKEDLDPDILNDFNNVAGGNNAEVFVSYMKRSMENNSGYAYKLVFPRYLEGGNN